MFQLILGISLGIILLFVILLLITEVAATYPVWKQFGSGVAGPLTTTIPQKRKSGRNTLRILLLVLTGVGLLGVLGYLVSTAREQPVSSTAILADTAPAGTQTKELVTRLAGKPLLFRLHTKWDDGKLLGTNRVSLSADSVAPFSECRYYLLDKEGFLVKELIFTPDDFVYETAPDGRVRGMLNRFNTPMHPKDYRKIEQLQVVLDKKVHPQSP